MGAIGRPEIGLASYEQTKILNPDSRKKKLRCPACGAQSFVPYIYKDSGKAVDIHACGRCDHVESCGYHKPPREYFAEHPEKATPRLSKEEWIKEQEKHREALRHEQQLMYYHRVAELVYGHPKVVAGDELPPITKAQPVQWRLPGSIVKRTEAAAEYTALYRFMCCHFDPAVVRNVFRMYHVGADKQGRTIFWQIDTLGEVRTGKIMRYQENGHRAKTPNGDPARGSFNWAHAIMKERGELPKEWALQQCFFGSHLLPENHKPVALVEAEKTALIAACAQPAYTWIATGGKCNLKQELFLPVREYIYAAGALAVFPDLGSTEDWKRKLEEMKMPLWLPYVVMDTLEKNATPEARARGLDLGDYLTGEF